MIRCRLQRLAALFSGGSAESHRKRCSLCRDEFAAEIELEKRLRAEIPPAKSVDISDDVMRRIRREERLGNAIDARSPARFPMFPALIGSAALIAVTVLFLRPKPSELPLGLAEVHPVQPAPLPQPLLPEVPVITPEQVENLTAKLNEPLQKELQCVISDTREAIQFVASNFMPEISTQP